MYSLSVKNIFTIFEQCKMECERQCSVWSKQNQYSYVSNFFFKAEISLINSLMYNCMGVDGGHLWTSCEITDDPFIYRCPCQHTRWKAEVKTENLKLRDILQLLLQIRERKSNLHICVLCNTHCEFTHLFHCLCNVPFTLHCSNSLTWYRLRTLSF